MPENQVHHFFEVDEVFANYTIVQYCGCGAYGEVYLAEDISHKRVALKVIPIASGSEVWKMELIGLRHYRQAIEDHSNLIEVLHVGETENFFYYTMEAADNMLHGDTEEYVPDTLSHRLERSGRMEPEKVLALAHSILDALEHLAGHDLAHRDLKPANIVYINGQPKLSDIGLISNTGVRSKVVGTLEYLPPEIADGDPVGYGHDLYSLGKVLYCALTGLLPEDYPEVPLNVPLAAWRQFKGVLLRACSPDPRQRFYSSEEFRKALPAAIRETSFRDETIEKLRSYRKLHPVLWRTTAVSLLLILLAAGMNFYLFMNYRHFERNQHQNKIDFIFHTIDLLNDRELQLQRVAVATGNTARFRQLQIIAELASSARAENDLDATERYCHYADATLKLWSEEVFRNLQMQYPLQPLPETPENLQNILKAYTDFKATPLTGHLLAVSQDKLANAIKELQTVLEEKWAGPIAGKEWSLKDSDNTKMVYISGSALDGEPAESYWIGTNEVTNSTLRAIIPELDRSPEADALPATMISWNDRLDICRKLTLQASEEGNLPENYIYRLPYASEWNFAARGGWNGKANFIHEDQLIHNYAWFGGNSHYQLHPVRSRQPGLMGLYDMIGNAAESVLLRPTEPGKTPAAGNYGASFRDRRVSLELQRKYPLELLNNRWSGFRLVLGRGSMDYFSNNWYSGAPRVTVLNNTTYEFLGGARCRWKGPDAYQWCQLLGVTPAVLHNGNSRQMLFNRVPQLKVFPCLVGASHRRGSWIWINNQPVNNGEWLDRASHSDKDQNSSHWITADYLIWDHGFWRGIDKNTTVPMLAVSYAPDHIFQLNNSESAKDIIMSDFTLQNRRFLLMRAPVDWYTAKRLAEMCGGKLAELDNNILQRAVSRQLNSFTDLRIALGGCRKLGKWQWLSGKIYDRKLPIATRSDNLSLNNYFMGCFNGKLHAAPEFDALLCELPAQSR